MSVFLTNVDDYLGPSQACVNPLFTAPSKSTSTNNAARDDIHDNPPTSSDTYNKVGAVQSKRRIRRRPPHRMIQNEEDESQRKEPVRLIHSTDDGFAVTSESTSPIKNKTKATVTLSDCLSCSGCVTSAEAVLMSHHSVEKFKEVARQSKFDGRRIVFTLSTAALADLYRHIYLVHGGQPLDAGLSRVPFNPSRQQFLRLITHFLHSEFGVALVIDGAVSQRMSLLESAREFCYRYRQQEQQRLKSKIQAYEPTDVTSVALSSTQTRYIKKKSNNRTSAIPDMIDMEEDSIEVTVVDHPPGLLLQDDDDYASSTNDSQNVNVQTPALPMLASSCPGFVCLVEKTAASVVPLLSSTKSPMSIAGTLLKGGMMGVQHESEILHNLQCFHVAVMPCHDKKLEAGRNDFAWEKQTLLKYTNMTKHQSNEGSSIVNEVDLVLTTGELLEILTTAAAQKSQIETSNTPIGIRELLELYSMDAESNIGQSRCMIITDTDSHETNGCKGSTYSSSDLTLDVGIHGSGSYADFIFRYAALDLFGYEHPHSKPLPWKGSSHLNSISNVSEESSSGVIRRRRRRQDTTDLRSLTLYKCNDGSYSFDAGEGSTSVLNFAIAYGFKNVQLVLQSLSKEGYSSGLIDAKRCDYVEVMACPSGCPNGGGQIGPMGQRETPRETKERVNRTLSVIPLVALKSDDERISHASKLYSEDSDGANPFLKGGCFGKHARRLLHTRFHVVPKLELSTGATAGVAVSDTKW